MEVIQGVTPFSQLHLLVHEAFDIFFATIGGNFKLYAKTGNTVKGNR